MIQIDLTADSNRRYKKLKNKKTKWIKSSLSVFSSSFESKKTSSKIIKIPSVEHVFSSLRHEQKKLTEIPKVYKPDPQYNFLRARRRLDNLDRMIARGENLSERLLRRYHRMCGILQIEIPEEIMQKFVAMPASSGKKKRSIQQASRKNPRSYKTYIKSQSWEDRKSALFRERPRKCEMCGSCKYIQVHHLRYDKALFGSEPSKDLAILCSFHHQDFHDKYKVQKDCHKNYEIYKNDFLKSI